jgi:hypothetical protein
VFHGDGGGGGGSGGVGACSSDEGHIQKEAIIMPSACPRIYYCRNSLFFNDFRIQLFLNQFRKSGQLDNFVKKPDTDCKIFQTLELEIDGHLKKSRIPDGDQGKHRRGEISG